MAQDETGRELGRHERYRGDYPIVVEGLTNAFGPQVVHENLDLKVRRGEILGVVGGSGTGKSVLMRSIIGLQRPTAGDIRVFGKSIIDTDPNVHIGIRNRWGVLFQGGALFSTLTVGENVEVPLKQFYPDIEADLRHEISALKAERRAAPKLPAINNPNRSDTDDHERIEMEKLRGAIAGNYREKREVKAVSYTHLTLPTILRV